MTRRQIDWTVAALLGVSIVASLSASAVPGWIRYLGQLSTATALASAGVMILLRAGLLSFGQGLFYFVGGYAVALTTKLAAITDAFVVLLVATISAGLVAAILGSFLARYRGIFFSMLTLAVSMVVFGIATKVRLFGGSDGLNIGLMSYAGYRPRGADAQWTGFVFCIWVWATFSIATHILLRSRFGWLIRAVADNEVRVEYLGYSVKQIVWVAYTIAGMLAGAGGALAGLSARHVDPQFAYWTTAGDFIFVVLLSGQASILSPPFGAFLLEVLRSYASALFPDQWQSVFGAMMLAIVLFLPAGLDRLVTVLWSMTRKAVSRRSRSLAGGSVS
ncbi:branched-chain amino acid ABC transporter permease [Bradyrhizobium sp. Arg237L]|uniref:branched-chain amino acid ABC transporter permease n=1 Tax=Bradyrhizobium sp. Arg237L TaxID=3003352 RepID=UPI00249E26C4|nr:branched-chain amino acid ABC transporter permease [Bradyrhizobium sp. Arg237L]MDI4237140.1 branched-chain amino acid ABC transporter permease [Bradyrhizobium sp. Arg237L]